MYFARSRKSFQFRHRREKNLSHGAISYKMNKNNKRIIMIIIIIIRNRIDRNYIKILKKYIRVFPDPTKDSRAPITLQMLQAFLVDLKTVTTSAELHIIPLSESVSARYVFQSPSYNHRLYIVEHLYWGNVY